MIEQELKPETAKLAKRKGFNAYSENFYVEGSDIIQCNLSAVCNSNTITKTYSQSLLAKWLREEHFIDTTPIYVAGIDNKIFYDSSVFSDLISEEESEEVNEYSELSFEEAWEKGLYEALELLPDVKQKHESEFDNSEFNKT